ncbi:MAG: hypothetical protein N3A57_01255 [Negativicutes bacterium]|nr:hypothetical protein [Negativicutes bacterium]
MEIYDRLNMNDIRRELQSITDNLKKISGYGLNEQLLTEIERLEKLLFAITSSPSR